MKAGNVSLRQWLDDPKRSIDSFECLHIFSQIVDNVSRAHSQGLVFHDVKPSCFAMSGPNCVSFVESSSCTSLDFDLLADGGISEIGGDQISSSTLRHPQKSASEGSCSRSSLAYGTHLSSVEELNERKSGDARNVEEEIEGSKKNFTLKQMMVLELKWYTSPEEVAGGSSSFSSDVYRLGVLLFELFCTFSSIEEKIDIMSNLRRRVLPPQLLLKWSKEAAFCMWLLHPQPDRPKMSDLLLSEFLRRPRDSLEESEAAKKVREEIEEQEFLLEFLLQLQQTKQQMANKLHEMIRFLSSDIDVVLKHHAILKKKENSFPCMKMDENIVMETTIKEDSTILGSRKRLRASHQIHTNEEINASGHNESIFSKSSRLMNDFKKLELAYFSMRCRPIKPMGKLITRNSADSIGKGSVVQTEGSSIDNLASKASDDEGRRGDWVYPFLQGLSNFLSFSKLKVRADLKHGDLLNSSNLICALSFDRDKQFFATAGVNRKIKVFDCDEILNEDRDIHYPVADMGGGSKISSVCWNGYIKSHIASSDFRGVVQVWDVTKRQAFMEMREHERRVWSVDFSLADPTMLASGSDDGAVKLWNINQRGSVATIRMKANVCSVQFPPDSSICLAIGSADHKSYYYDLRSTRLPLCTFIGHTKTVSYVRFVDSTTLVTASTDNSLKLWDLATGMPQVIDSPIQTFTGHTNTKNFVGLSISKGYIVTGSETNEVIVYHKAFPMPVLSFKFDDTEGLFGHGGGDSAAPFISSVCWRGQSTALVAANSNGNIKLLEMV